MYIKLLIFLWGNNGMDIYILLDAAFVKTGIFKNNLFYIKEPLC